MNYCIYIKRRKGKPFCTYFNKEVTWNECKECKKKVYKMKNKKNSFYTKSESNSKNAQYLKKAVQRKLHEYSKMSITVQKSKKLSLKSKKIAKLERNRYSVFTNDLKHCFICKRKKEELHEIYAGRNRLNSMKYGFVLPLCHECHSLNQNNPFFNDFWHKNGQEYWECNIGSRNEFIAIFRRNYLD